VLTRRAWFEKKSHREKFMSSSFDRRHFLQGSAALGGTPKASRFSGRRKLR
jgi:hypothetical protein